jgi:hypothetical protein
MAKPILPLPGSTRFDPGPESPWTNTPSAADDVPGMPPRAKDPRSLSEGIALDTSRADDKYPGSGFVTDPWKSPPAPTPRRLRRDS